MGYREARELARIRCELREHLLARRCQDVAALLERLRAVAEQRDPAMPELQGEYQRWKLRFDLLDVN